MLERYLIPLGPYAMLAAGLLAAMFLFATLSREVRALKMRLRHEVVRGEDLARDFKSRLDDMIMCTRQAEDRAGTFAPPAPLPSGLNLDKRAQAIRMSRRGDRADLIAAVLNLPSREVQLLLKVHEIAAGGSTELTA